MRTVTLPELTPDEQQHYSILLVEDNPGDARLVREALIEAGGESKFALQWVQTIAEARARLQAHPVDLVLLDLGLPDSMGLVTVGAIQAAAHDVPVVVLTGSTDEQLSLDAMRVGAQDYLKKSELRPEIVARAIRYAIERHRLQTQLEHSHRVTRLSTLAAALAHHFNNVLMGIQPHVELIKRNATDNARVQSSVEQIDTALKRGKYITAEITRFTRPAPCRIASIDVSSWFDALQSELMALAREDVTIAIDPPDTGLTAAADADQLRTVVKNLVTNSLQAISGPGVVTIGAAAVPASALGGWSLPAGARYVEFHVTDTGHGIDADVLPRIFEPLFTTRRPAAGLGLASVYQILEAHGGRIQASSEPGSGTAIRFVIPQAG